MATFGETVLDGAPVKIDGDELLIPLRLPWYRALALSTIDALELLVNGAPVNRDDIRLEVGGEEYRLDETAPLWLTFWRVEEPAVAHVPAPEGLGSTAEVTAVLTNRIPYIQFGPGRTMARRVETTRTLEVAHS